MELQSPRMKLLYFIYKAPSSKIKDVPGIKSKLRKALDYRSDGHFYHDLNHLLESGMLEKKDDYYIVTKEGKEKFELHSTLFKISIASIALGITLIFYYFLLELNLLTEEGICMIGCVLIFSGLFSWIITKKNEPKLSDIAKKMLRKLTKN